MDYIADFPKIEAIFNKLSKEEQLFVSHESQFVPMGDISWYRVTENAFIEVCTDNLFDIAVLKEARNKGIASKLIIEAFNIFGYLGTYCHPKNKASIHMLHSLGFNFKGFDDEGWLYYEKTT